MKRTERGPKQAKAVVAVCVATAILLGGGSTYARWAQSAALAAESEPTLTTGGWAFAPDTPLPVVDQEWFDVHEAVHDGYTSSRFTYGDWDSTVGGLSIGKDPAAFPIVPGDSLVAVLTFADTVPAEWLTDFDGVHLEVKVGTVSLADGQVGADVTISREVADPITAEVLKGLDVGPGRLAVRLDYAFDGNENENESIKHFEADSGRNLEATLSITGLQVTVVQVQEPAATS
jgi:hypothetical protein